MGYGRKNTNRGEAIARNTERVRDFGRRLDLHDREARVLRALMESNQRMNEIRLDRLERPIRQKIGDWIRTTVKRIRDRIRAPAPDGLEPTEVIIDEAAAIEEATADPPIQLVNQEEATDGRKETDKIEN